MVRDTPVSRRDDAQICAEAEGLDDLGDIAGEHSDARRLLRIGLILAQHKAVILDCGATARGIDRDGVEPGRQALAFPGIDVGASEIESGGLLPKMMGKRSTTAAALSHDHFAAMPGKKSDCRFVDFGRQNPLRAPGQ
jgi:hypothetical protein